MPKVKEQRRHRLRPLVDPEPCCAHGGVRGPGGGGAGVVLQRVGAAEREGNGGGPRVGGAGVNVEHLGPRLRDATVTHRSL